MASAVDIANLALSHLGDAATVSSLDPPEGSAQATHCARFYPIARNALLEMHTWGFATQRIALAEVTNPSTSWQFAYALPANLLKVIAVLPKDASDDYQANYSSTIFPQTDVPVPTLYTPQPYVVENGVILTNVEDAVLRYTVVVTDTTKFSPLFTLALSWLLASMLAGPIIKGDTGAAEAKRCLAMAEVFKGQAATSDANQRRVTVTPNVPWVAGR